MPVMQIIHFGKIYKNDLLSADKRDNKIVNYIGNKMTSVGLGLAKRIKIFKVFTGNLWLSHAGVVEYMSSCK